MTNSTQNLLNKIAQRESRGGAKSVAEINNEFRDRVTVVPDKNVRPNATIKVKGQKGKYWDKRYANV